MRKLALFALILILLLGLVPAAAAVPAASQLGCMVSVGSDGVCVYHISLTLTSDQAGAQLVYPLPRDAWNVSVNGSRVRTQRLGDVQLVDLSQLMGNAMGAVTVNLQYNLNSAVSALPQETTDDEQPLPERLELRLPLLSGFAYPVEKMTFSITLPMDPGEKPAFTSGYHQTSIEQDLHFSVSGANVTGETLAALKDHETLSMVLVTDRQMFPDLHRNTQSTTLDDMVMAVCGGLALLYWLLFLRCAPFRSRRCPTPPHGYNAGQVGAVISLRGTSFSLMVLSWAQLGYVTLAWDRRGHVLIRKGMDMGNERSGFEQRCFQKLFRRGPVMDTTSLAYAVLCAHAAKTTPYLQPLLRRRSGNPVVMRFLAALMGACAGVSAGLVLCSGAALQWVLTALLAAVCGWLSWWVQDWAGALYLAGRKCLGRGALAAVALAVPSFLAGEGNLSLLVIGAQLLAGLLAAFGGRRTGLGIQVRSELLGLRKYMKTVSPVELQRITGENPDYFFSLLPYAMAMGVDRRFASRFGRVQRFGCHWLVGDAEWAAGQWCEEVRKILQAMDARYEQLPVEQLLRRFRR